MSIDEAVEKLQEHLGEPDVFFVRHNGEKIIVNVNFIYRTEDVKKLGGTWEGYDVSVGRRSCW